MKFTSKLSKKTPRFRGIDDDLMSLSAKHIMTSPDDSQIILEKAQFLSQPADYGRPHLRWNPGQALTQLTWIGKKKPRTMDKETKKCIALTTLLKTNQIAERSFTSKSRIEVSFENWLTPPANCQEFQEDVCFFLLYAYAFVEALFLSLISNWGVKKLWGRAAVGIPPSMCCLY